MHGTKPPNLLLLFTDQQRFDTIGALGNPAIRTPHLDRLVCEGTAFTSAYAPAAECVPSRCCLTFGQYPGRTRCYNNGFPMPWDTKDNVMSALGRQGYFTHGIGKCHFTPESRKTALNGFTSRERQEEIADSKEHDEYLRFLQDHGGAHITDPHGVRGEMYYIPQPAQMAAELHPTQWVGDRSEAFLRDPARQDQPWFLFSSFIHPHPPFCPPAPWHKLYRELDLPLPHTPDGCEKLLVMVNHQQNRMKRRDRGWDINLVRMIRAYYYASISFIDFQIGRILRSLEETGQLENTLIIFSSDHGELLGDFRSFGKRSYHDPASRIPMLMRGPGVAPGRRSDVPVSLLDVTATLLAQAGAEFSTHQPDGTDLAAMAQNPPEDRFVFSQLNRAGDGLYMALNRRWKFVYSAPDRRQLLFDRRNDPGETTDLGAATWDANWPTQQAQTQMRDELIRWLTNQGEEAALDDGKLKLYPKRDMPQNPDSWLLYQDHPWADQFLPGYSTTFQS
jgi:arylsulfatase A-like enzyme